MAGTCSRHWEPYLAISALYLALTLALSTPAKRLEAPAEQRGRGPCHHDRMLKTLKDLFAALMAPQAGAPGALSGGAEHALQLATAVLLVEVMRADTSFHPGERDAVRAALTEKFALTPNEADRLSELAQTAAGQATDLFSYTSLVDTHFSPEQKVRMVELMWQVAYADGHLADHERHTLWRVADLLHVPQSAYAAARQHARDAAPGPGARGGQAAA